MPFHRLRRLVQGQGGSTLIELLVAMPIAILLLGLVIQSLGTAGKDQQDIEGRTEALTNGQIGLERMTRELRQAQWIFFRSSAVVDIDVTVRATATSTGVERLVRFDCSGLTCVRYEGNPVAYPPPASPTFASSKTLIGDTKSLGDRNGQLVNHDIFRPYKIDPNTGTRTADFVSPDFLAVRMQFSFRDRHLNTAAGEQYPLVLEDGVSLRNRTNYAS